MDWYTQLRVSEDLEKKKDKIIDKIEHGVSEFYANNKIKARVVFLGFGLVLNL